MEDLKAHGLAYKRKQLAAVMEGRPSPRACGLLMFSCNGRGTNLYEEPSYDARTMGSFVRVPSAGFLCNGEIATVGGSTKLHGFTCAAAILQERDVATQEQAAASSSTGSSSSSDDSERGTGGSSSRDFPDVSTSQQQQQQQQQQEGSKPPGVAAADGSCTGPGCVQEQADQIFSSSSSSDNIVNNSSNSTSCTGKGVPASREALKRGQQQEDEQ